jgi:acyl-CoA reductase-like NAD-dependent aldehyde dehydrogenase
MRPVGSYFQADPEQVEQAFQAAHEAFERNCELTPAARSRFLSEVAAVSKRRSQEFVDLLIREAGKPVTQAKTEVARAQSTFLFAASECLQPNGDPRDRETVIGPTIAPEAVQKVTKWVDQAIAAGAKLATKDA